MMGRRMGDDASTGEPTGDGERKPGLMEKKEGEPYRAEKEGEMEKEGEEPGDSGGSSSSSNGGCEVMLI